MNTDYDDEMYSTEYKAPKLPTGTLEPFFDKMNFFWEARWAENTRGWLPQEWTKALTGGYRVSMGTPLYLTREDAIRAAVKAWKELSDEQRAGLEEYREQVAKWEVEVGE